MYFYMKNCHKEIHSQDSLGFLNIHTLNNDSLLFSTDISATKTL